MPAVSATANASLPVGPDTSTLTGGGYCAPPALGSPCATGGLTIIGGTEPVPTLGIGNPVHLATGNKYQMDVDLPPNPSAPGLELVRHYNGLSTQAGVLGRNWRVSYDTRLQRRGNQWRLLQADGSILDILEPTPTAKGYAWHSPDGRRLHFDADGRLVSIRKGPRVIVNIRRHPKAHAYAGLIERVESAAGSLLAFHYRAEDGQILLEAVDTPLGRFEYRYNLPPGGSAYGAARLASVVRPDGLQRLYHYDDAAQAGNPYALTGISLQAIGGTPQRLTSWEYDAFGRVTALRQHGRGLADLQLEYVRSARGAREGVTRVHSANGLQADVLYQRAPGGYRLLSSHIESSDADDAPVQYDASGRLTSVGGLRLLRSPQGRLLGVEADAGGWPGLALRLDAADRYTWFSEATGRTTLWADRRGRPAQLQYANGDTLLLQYDPQGRPAQLEYFGAAANTRYTTRLQWRGHRLQRIEHPFETETRQYDAKGRVVRRHLYRPALFGSPSVRFDERFRHDEQGRLLYHALPEGGALHYTWRDDVPGGAGLAALHWEDANGTMHPVLTSTKDRPGYRYGNGLAMLSAAVDDPHADTLVLSTGGRPLETNSGRQLWRQTRQHDAKGRVLSDTHVYPDLDHTEHLYFVHDENSRLQAATQRLGEVETPWWYAWRGDGSLAALQEGQFSLRLAISRDASGLPRSVGELTLTYGPSRRLEQVQLKDGGQARYRHNAFGHRIAKQVRRAAAPGHADFNSSTTHYLYLHDQLSAEARSLRAGEAIRVTRRYLYAGFTPVGMIDYPAEGEPQLYAVHADLSGAARMVTDAAGNIRWLAGYSPTGQAKRLAGDLDFRLRFPGQYEDEETGWHDNLLRTYMPQLGHYLEPDPLGPLPQSQAFGYAAQQPWRHIDPHGLLLFAFDGTRHSADTMSNTWLLAQAYRDGPAHYHSGPGNSMYLDWDAVVAWRAGRILENQWQALLTSLENQPAGTTVPIDIIGFSRGASLARHFGNRIASNVKNGVFSVDDPMRGRVSACVDLRFMGLFDTVGQFGVAGSHNHLYDFAITEMWSWVAHAVALHEHRWTFPLTSADAGGAGNVVEVPLVGAHADIGGGLVLHNPPGADSPDDNPQNAAAPTSDSDLAKIALAWMHWQAQAAAVDFTDLDPADTTVHAPLLRDMRSRFMRSVQQGDRAILAPSGRLRLSYQDDDSRLGRQTRQKVENFISRAIDWRRADTDVVGEVDMEAYSRWLEDVLGWRP